MIRDKGEFARNIKQQIERLDNLPAMPEIARDLLRLRNNANADIKMLAEVVERDPSLAAQIMRYARLSIFGYGSKINSIQKALTQVLGFDMGLHMAVGMTAGQQLHMPPGGPLGREAFWRHSVYSATLVQDLGNALPAAQRPQAGLLYLAGLLHNFGFLLLGHLHPTEFTFVNHVYAQSSSAAIREIELQLLGVRHELLGTWLMQAWDMPEEVIITTREHHYPDYDGKHSTYAKLTLLADRALARYGLGDGDSVEFPRTTLETLGITEEQITTVVERLLGVSEELNVLVEQLAA